MDWQWLGNFGLGAVFAVLILIIWVRERKISEERYKAHCEETAKLMKDILQRSLDATVENTKVTSEMTTLLKAMNGKLSKMSSTD